MTISIELVGNTFGTVNVEIRAVEGDNFVTDELTPIEALELAAQIQCAVMRAIAREEAYRANAGG